MAGSEPKRILLTMAGGLLGIPISDALRTAPEPVYLIGVDSSPYHAYTATTDEVHIAPRADEPDFIDVLAKVAKETNADFIWPMHDAEIERVTERVDELPAKTWLPPHDVVLSTADKRKTYQLLKSAGVPTADTIDLYKGDDLKTAFEEYGGEVWLRSATGGGGAGALLATELSHARSWVDMHDGWGNFTASRVLPGPGDHVVDSIWNHGELILAQKLTRVVRGITGISLHGVTSRGVQLCDGPDSLNEISAAAIKALTPRPHGIFRVDFVVDANGVPNVTEIDSGRFTTTNSVNWFPVGINMPRIVVKLAFGESLDFEPPLINPYPTDIMSVSAINRSQVFIKRSEVEELEKTFRSRRGG